MASVSSWQLPPHSPSPGDGAGHDFEVPWRSHSGSRHRVASGFSMGKRWVEELLAETSWEYVNAPSSSRRTARRRGLPSWSAGGR